MYQPHILKHKCLIKCCLDLQTSGRRSRTTSESSNHSGRERSSSLVNQGSPPPPPIPEAPPQDGPKKTKKDSPRKVLTYKHIQRPTGHALENLSQLKWMLHFILHQGASGGWLTWLIPKRKNEAHLPDDKNKSVGTYFQQHPALSHDQLVLFHSFY